ncbi:tyrosine-type recombinase/integrase [Streptomyces sp. NPDC053069]|uniref:tyrosine-type recombinase/integrase n=1 Tax=Streptomyces sp. NPDC053069 TaxID=3365695 RepID=UPI0037D4D4EB
MAPGGNHVWCTSLNEEAWKPALVAAGVIPKPQTKAAGYAAAREHGMHALRHFYASALLDGGENIKAVSECLGHSNAALTPRIYAHLMPRRRRPTWPRWPEPDRRTARRRPRLCRGRRGPLAPSSLDANHEREGRMIHRVVSSSHPGGKNGVGISAANAI